jgi:glycosyltransferase involved in cell wall biosynthesis
MNITVCVPCFEQGDTLPDTLQSLKAQTQPADEVLVIDDGSGDDQAQKIASVCDLFDATLIRQTNRGLPGARNTGLMLATGEAFLPLDADDWLEPTYIEDTLPLLDEHDVVLTGLQEHGPTRNGQYMPGYDRPWDQVTLDVIWADGAGYNRFFYAALFRTQLLRSVGGYNGRMIHGYEDWDLWIDLMKRGVRFAAINKPLFNYRTNPGSMLSRTEAMRGEVIAEMRRHLA